MDADFKDTDGAEEVERGERSGWMAAVGSAVQAGNAGSSKFS
jgi:hypothetical protein